MQLKYYFTSVTLLSSGMIMRAADHGLAADKTSNKPPNIIFILSDDHRYDFMGFTGRVPGLVTPGFDRMAREGVCIQNAFVSTSLSSPSRASILTGQYAHTHKVVNNFSPLPENLMFFPQYLQRAGYRTAFFGKWHMGNGTAESAFGFDHLESFAGQGEYYNPHLLTDGTWIQYNDSTYSPVLLTDHTLEFMKEQVGRDRPFFVYLSHKAVHEDFQPAKRDKGRYRDLEIQYPPSMWITAGPDSKKYMQGKRTDGSSIVVNYKDIPGWVREQRYSEHGVDYMAHGMYEFDQAYLDYLECLMGVDNSIERILDYLTEAGLKENTLVIYMGDNGFAFGEHGLVDKRTAYEESMRVPMLAWGTSRIKPGAKIKGMVLNIDIAPTILDLAGVKKPGQMQGESFLPLLADIGYPWRGRIYYEYYWEYDYPHTPTQYAVRTDRYKFIMTVGIWDINQLYDLSKDPWEVNNLIRSPEHQEIAKQLTGELWDWLEKTGGLSIPLYRNCNARGVGDHKYLGTW